MRTYIAAFFALFVLAPFALGQDCYLIVAQSFSSTQCQGPPSYTTMSRDSFSEACNATRCVESTYYGQPLENFFIYTRDLTAVNVPKPENYVELKHFSDSKCTDLTKIEYFENGAPCNNNTYRYNTCDQKSARIRSYYTGKCDVYSATDNYFPLGECTAGSSDYVIAGCSLAADQSQSPATSQAIAQSNSAFVTALIVLFVFLCM